ncbi:MAG: hypothetical protein HOP08_17445 [Cyclobacteriaceae bacterium]|nr:hypothetical protein [Cyclobacteriaceae bacterium]
MAHQLSTVNFRQRVTQLLVLVILIIACILFSLPADAQRANRKAKSKNHVSLFKSKSDKACYLLYKKRTSNPKRSLFASAPRRAKYKPMAETDQPGRFTTASVE